MVQDSRFAVSNYDCFVYPLFQFYLSVRGGVRVWGGACVNYPLSFLHCLTFRPGLTFRFISWCDSHIDASPSFHTSHFPPAPLPHHTSSPTFLSPFVALTTLPSAPPSHLPHASLTHHTFPLTFSTAFLLHPTHLSPPSQFPTASLPRHTCPLASKCDEANVIERCLWFISSSS